MGGNAFVAKGYNTPRVPDKIWQYLKDIVVTKVQEAMPGYAIRVPEPAPAKIDHGDLDLLVCKIGLDATGSSQTVPTTEASDSKGKTVAQSPLSPFASEAIAVGKAIGAAAMIVNELTVNMCSDVLSIIGTDGETAAHDNEDGQDVQTAVRVWVDSIIEANSASVTTAPAVPASKFASPTTTIIPPDPARIYLQVDIHTLANEEHLKWMYFTHSHGDKLMILNILTRPLGLVAKEDGLYVRLKEIQDAGETKKGCHVFVTGDPRRYVEFLGLQLDGAGDSAPADERFETEEELFRWAISSPLFGATVRDSLKITSSSTTESETSTSSAKASTPSTLTPDATPTAPPPTSLIRNKDRSHLRKRGMFSRFMSDFLPIHTSSFMDRTDYTRSQVFTKLLEDFAADGVKETVDAAFEAFRKRQEEFGSKKSKKARRRAEMEAKVEAVKGVFVMDE